MEPLTHITQFEVTDRVKIQRNGQWIEGTVVGYIGAHSVRIDWDGDEYTTPYHYSILPNAGIYPA